MSKQVVIRFFSKLDDGVHVEDVESLESEFENCSCAEVEQVLPQDRVELGSIKADLDNFIDFGVQVDGGH